MSPKISIVTVTYNGMKTIEDTISSVLGQSYENIEYIVVDGGSTDRTLEVIDRYADRIATVISEPDEGIYDAMNKGIKAATGDFVGILNSDDIFSNSDVIARLADYLSANPDADAVYANLVMVTPDDTTKVTRKYFSNRYHFWKARFGLMVPHPTFYTRRSSFEAYGYYKMDYRVAADFELMLRHYRGGQKFQHFDTIMVRMREGGISTTGFWWRLHQNMEIVRACRENGVYTNILFVLSKIPAKIFLRYIWK